MSDPKTIEESILSLPNVEEGVYRLGDLWDCRTSKSPALNIFGGDNNGGGKLNKDYVQVYPVQSSQYVMNQIKSASGRMTALHVSAYISFELQSGRLKVAGGASFDQASQKKFNEEEFFCQLDVSTFVIRLVPDIHQIIDLSVKERIINGTEKATHYVQEIRLGADALGCVRISENLDDTKMDLGGEFDGKFTVETPIPLTFGIKASLEWLEEDGSSYYSTTATLVTHPNHGQAPPNNIIDMFKCIDGLEKEIQVPYDPAFFGETKVYGAPVRFKLAPISQLFELPDPPKYQVMDEEMRNSFLNMLLTLLDFTNIDHVKNLLREKDYRFSAIFESNMPSDDGTRVNQWNENPFTIAVTSYELQLKQEAMILRQDAMIVFDAYKLGETDAQGIAMVIKKYEEEFNIERVTAQVLTFLTEGKGLLNAIHAPDASLAEKPDLFIKDEFELRDWFNNEQEIKILLKTNGEASEGVFLKLYKMTPILENTYAIRVRVAYPNIVHAPFSLQLKIKPEPEIYEGLNIGFFLDVLNVVIGGGAGRSTTRALFYTILAQVRGYTTSPKELNELPTLVKFLQEEAGEIIMCETYPQFLEALSDTDGNGEWKFVIPIQAIKCGWEMVWTYSRMREQFKQFRTPISHNWIVANVNLNNVDGDGPLLFVFRRNQLRAVCLDHLDIHILMNQLKLSDKPDLSILDSARLRENCFYPGRANFALQVMEILNTNHSTTIQKLVQPLPSLNTDVAPEIIAAIKVTEMACSGSVYQVASVIAVLTLENFQKLEPMFKRFGWTEIVGFNQVSDADTWKTFGEELSSFIADKSNQMPEDIVVNDLNGDLFNMKQLQLIAHQLGASQTVPLGGVCQNYTERISSKDYGDQLAKVKTALDMGKFYEALGLLAQRDRDPKLFKMLYDFSYKSTVEFTDGNFMRNTLEKMLIETEYNFTDDNIQDIWFNPKFQFWMAQGEEDDALVGTIEELFCREGIPSYIPPQIADRIKQSELGEGKYRGGFYEWSKVWNNVEDVIQTFQIINTRGVIPLEFSAVLRKNLEQNAELRAEIDQKGALFYWNQDGGFLEQPWDLKTIEIVVTKLMPPAPSGSDTQKSSIVRKEKDVEATLKLVSDTRSKPPIAVNAKWDKFTGGTLERIDASDSIARVNSMIEPPFVQTSQSQLTTTMRQTLPYLSQELKFGNVESILPSQVVDYINYPQESTTGKIPSRQSRIRKEEEFLVTRSDFLTALLTCTDPILTNYILRRMAEVQYALPLIMPDITIESTNGIEPIKVLLDQLRTLVVPEFIITHPEPHLFIKPYRFVVIIRVGEAPQGVGKSTILNRVLMTQHDGQFFSCRDEPGAELGRVPISRKGLTEVTWLNSNHLVQGSKEIIMLANVHGDALELENVLYELSPLATGYIVFWSATNWKDLKKKQVELETIMRVNNQACLHLLVDPNDALAKQVGEHNTVRTEDLASERQKIEKVLMDAITRKNIMKPKAPENSQSWSPFNMFQDAIQTFAQKPFVPFSLPTSVVPSITTSESTALLHFVTKIGVQAVKTALEYELAPKDESSDILDNALNLFSKILALVLTDRNMAFAHISTELEYLSAKSSVMHIKRLQAFESDLRSLRESGSSEKYTLELKADIKLALAKLNDSVLHISDFLGALLRKIEEPSNLTKLYEYFVDSAYPIEAFTRTFENRESEGALWPSPIDYCFKKLLNINPGLRVFVLSIIGLTGTFKSTLMNMLFGYGFREGPGGCTKGIAIKIHYLEENLRKELEFDAFLLLDTEGTRATYNWLDDEATLRENQLLSFVLVVSQITILNVATDSFQGLNGVLPISLLNIQRLPNDLLPSQPDILLARHKTGDFDVQPPVILEELSAVFHKLRTVCHISDFEIGMRRPPDSGIDKINQRLSSKEQFYYKIEQESPEKGKSIRQIYNQLIQTIKVADKVPTLETWYTTSQKYWDCIVDLEGVGKAEDLSELQKSMEQTEKLDEIKTAVEMTFRKHGKEILLRYLESIGNDLVDSPAILLELNRVPYLCNEGADESRCTECEKVVKLVDTFLQNYPDNTIRDIVRTYVRNVRDSIQDKCIHMGLAKELKEGIRGELSKELDAILEGFNENELSWKKFKQFVSTQIRVVPGIRYLESDIVEEYKMFPYLMERLPLTKHSVSGKILRNIPAIDFERPWSPSPINSLSKIAQRLNWKQARWLQIQLDGIVLATSKEIELGGTCGGSLGMARLIRQRVIALLADFETKNLVKLLPDFKNEVHFYTLVACSHHLEQMERQWNLEYGLLQILEARREEFPELFAAVLK